MTKFPMRLMVSWQPGLLGSQFHWSNAQVPGHPTSQVRIQLTRSDWPPLMAQLRRHFRPHIVYNSSQHANSYTGHSVFQPYWSPHLLYLISWCKPVGAASGESEDCTA